ncbi:MAG TPA: hypothetical protein VHX60_12950 [Acidobacteriaceae bacterium]|jgi:hypothetical protein|nr:hypothetical protein [Acidobacteriaceae bacterium]
MIRFLAISCCLLLPVLPTKAEKPAGGEKSVTLDQLQQILAADAGKPDLKVADQLANLRLRERAGTARLEAWQSSFKARRTREALLRLADQSAFLDPPAADIPTTPAPPLKDQGAILIRALAYVRQTLPTLPDFLATRVTTHFQDDPLRDSPPGLAADQLGLEISGVLPGSAAANPQRLRETTVSRLRIAYRNGKEVEDSRRHTQQMAAEGLTTSGEFGPILVVVLGDALRGTVTWGYWENGEPGPIAVLRYRVPRENSHYAVSLPVGETPLQEVPGYHGEVALNPRTGAILRITVIADLAAPNQDLVADIAVDYGPVAIGDATRICPIRGVALSTVPVRRRSDAALPANVQTSLNDIAFTDYHLFHADVRITPAQTP